MAITFIDTNKLPRVKTDSGDVAEILNKDLCGAENVAGKLHWLVGNDSLSVSGTSHYQLFYVMEGEGIITLDTKEYHVKKGSGVYLGPLESAKIAHSGPIPLKLFHLIVREIPS